MPAPHAHRLSNRLQTWLLMGAMLLICSTAGGILFGGLGALLALGMGLLVVFLEPAGAGRLTLGLYRARPLSRAEAPGLWLLLDELSQRAGLPRTPVPHRIAGPRVNAFAVGYAGRAAIALTDGMLHGLSGRELTGVLAHEIAHIAHEDLRVMGLADYISRITSLFALVGQLLILLSLPMVLLGEVSINWPAMLLLILSPHLMVLIQLGLSRTREFAADEEAARLTGDPRGLAAALARIERHSRGLLGWLLPNWRTPEPSWLRTHPLTEERVQRLMDMAEGEGHKKPLRHRVFRR